MNTTALKETVKKHRKFKHKHRHKHKRKHSHADDEYHKGGYVSDSGNEKRRRNKEKNKDTEEAREKNKEKRRSSRGHKKGKRHRDESEVKSKEKSRERKKKKKEKEKHKDKSEEILNGPEHTLDLSTLTKEEVKAIRKVIKKDEAEMRAMDMRVSILRSEISALRQSSAECLGPGSDYNSSNARCPRCRKEFPAWQNAMPFLDNRVRCQACKFRVCKDCRYLQPNGLYLCRLCVCYRQEKLLTGEWMDAAVGGVHSTDLIKLSLRDKKRFKKKRRREERKKAEQAKRLLLEGFFGKRKGRHRRRKRSTAKTKKRNEDDSCHKTTRRHRSVKGHHKSRREVETTKKAQNVNEQNAAEKQQGTEMRCVDFNDEVVDVDTGCLPEESYDYYGTDYWGSVRNGIDPYDYNYDGYYFDGFGEGEDEGYEEEYYDEEYPPEKSGLEPEVYREEMDLYWSNATFASREFHELNRSEQQEYLRQLHSTKNQFFQAQGGPGLGSLPCVDYMPLSQPPPYQEHCPYVTSYDERGMYTIPYPLPLAAPAYGTKRPCVITSKNKTPRRILPSWKRVKFFLKESFRFMVPSLVRRDKNHSKKDGSELDLDRFNDVDAGALYAKPGDSSKGSVHLADINWNFQPKSSGHQHGGGRIGVGRSSRSRGRGRGMSKRAKATRSSQPINIMAEEDEEDGGDNKEKKKKHKKKMKKRMKKSQEDDDAVTNAVSSLTQKLSKSEDKASVSSSQQDKLAKCPPKPTEDAASQTSKRKRSALMEFLCPFCRFNIEWE